MSDIFNKIKNFSSENNISQDTINNLFNILNNSNNNSTTSTNTSDSSHSQSQSFNNNGIDYETMLRMKSIIDKMNTKDDPRSNLLQSLKPYLNDSRKSKVDQYIRLMNMSRVLDVFPFMGGENKK